VSIKYLKPKKSAAVAETGGIKLTNEVAYRRRSYEKIGWKVDRFTIWSPKTTSESDTGRRFLNDFYAFYMYAI